MNAFASVFRDLYSGTLRWHELWLTLGWRDVLLRYRRSLLGPLWIPLSMAIVALAMGWLYSGIMKRPVQTFVPYLATGMIVWTFLQGLITDGTQAFVSNASAIKEIPVPGSVHVLRAVWRNLLVFVQHLPVYLALVLFMGVDAFPGMLLAIPGLLIVLLNGLWIGLLFGLVNVRVRDFTQVIANTMRLVFFITPIIWFAEAATGARRMLVAFNPFYYFIEILRGPMLGAVPEPRVWAIALAITAAGWIVTVPVYARWHRSIPYYV